MSAKFKKQPENPMQTIEFLQRLVQALMFEPLPCPYCEMPSCIKLNVGVMYNDAMVMPYQCWECNNICTVVIDRVTEDMTITQLTPGSAKELIEVFGRSEVHKRMIPQVTRQRREMNGGKN